MAALAAGPTPDILVNNCGGPPHGDFRGWSVEEWQKAGNNNMLTPIMLIKATVDGMCERKFGRIVNITSGSVKSPIPNLGMSNGAARRALTAFCAGLARQVAKYNVTINGVLPVAHSSPTGCALRHRVRQARRREHPVRGAAGEDRAERPRRAASATLRNSAMPAPSCAPPRRDSSSGP